MRIIIASGSLIGIVAEFYSINNLLAYQRKLITLGEIAYSPQYYHQMWSDIFVIVILAIIGGATLAKK
jgi:hypothetical protein